MTGWGRQKELSSSFAYKKPKQIWGELLYLAFWLVEWDGNGMEMDGQRGMMVL